MYNTTSSSNIFQFLFTDKRHFSCQKTKFILQWCLDVAVWCSLASTSPELLIGGAFVWTLWIVCFSFNVTFHCDRGKNVTCGLIQWCNRASDLVIRFGWMHVNSFNSLYSQRSAANSDLKRHIALLRGAFVPVLSVSPSGASSRTSGVNNTSLYLKKNKKLTEHNLGNSRV